MDQHAREFWLGWLRGVVVLGLGILTVWLAALAGLQRWGIYSAMALVAIGVGMLGEAMGRRTDLPLAAMVLFAGYLFGVEFFAATGPDSDSNFSAGFVSVAPVLLLVAGAVALFVALGGAIAKGMRTRREAEAGRESSL